MKTIVISLGGSIIIPSDIRTPFLKMFKKFVMSRPERFIIITGGGNICRVYQDACREFGKTDDEDLDWLGIQVTRLNALLIKGLFGDVAEDKLILDPALPIESEKKVILGGGWKPGNSTDLAAVTIAENLGADTVINLSNIKYVYDKDPHIPGAKPIHSMSWEDFRSIVGDKWEPGMNMPFDPIAAKKAEELGIKVVIMDGTEIDNLNDFMEGKDFVGTEIK